MTTTPLFLISCVAEKAPAPCAARDLYRSDWFRKARAFAEAAGRDYLVLSAAHGVLDPGQEVAPYDATLNTMDRAERQAWAEGIMRQLRQRGQIGRPVVILAGQGYREFLEPLLVRALGDADLVTVPMRGLGIGQQKAWLAARAAEAARDRAEVAGDSTLEALERHRVDLVAWFDTVGRANLTRADCVRYLGRAASPDQRDGLRLRFELDRRLALLRLSAEREDLDAAILERRQAIPLERARRAHRQAQAGRCLRRIGRSVRQLVGLAFTPAQELAA